MQSKVSSKKIKSDFNRPIVSLKRSCVHRPQSPKQTINIQVWNGALIQVDESIAAGTKVRSDRTEVRKLHIQAVEF